MDENKRNSKDQQKKGRKTLKSPQEIYKRIEDAYETEKGKRFITHLIGSFFPESKTNYMFFPKEKTVYCCISNTRLFSKSEMIEASIKITPKEVADDLKKVVNGDKNRKHPIRKHIEEGVLGIESSESDKFLCHNAHQQLYKFYINKLMSGDKHLNWLAKNSLNSSLSFLSIKEQQKIATKKEQPKSMKMGDLEAFKKLREKK